MTDSPPPDGLKNLAIVAGSLALVFAGAAGFEAVVGIKAVSYALPIALGLAVVAAACYALGRRAGPPPA